MSTRETTYAAGIDVSTQSISAALIGAVEEGSEPSELVLSDAWRVSAPCADEAQRKSPAVWVELVRELIGRLKNAAPEAAQTCSIGISTTFPGLFAILGDGSTDPRLASLYDNTEDAGVCSGAFDDLLAQAEAETLNRMWPGNMAVGLVHLLRSGSLRLDAAAALVPPNTAFAYELLRSAHQAVEPGTLPSDLTQTVIGGLYDARTAEPLPPAVARLIETAVPGIQPERLRRLLPRAVPSWRNIVPCGALPALRAFLGLPKLAAVSIGAGDSPLGALALCADPDAVLNVRGSSDSPMLAIDLPRQRQGGRETVLHYPMPTAAAASDSPWCAVAPMLRSGKVWDWVRRLRFGEDGPDADRELERLAVAALKRRLSVGAAPLLFDTALGGERAPDWNSRATGTLAGLVESHGIGDVALAALEGMSVRLRACIELMESRYGVKPSKLILAGGPVRNALWNWVTAVVTGKRTFVTEFADASLLGAAMVGYAASYDGRELDQNISARLRSVSRIAAQHPHVAHRPVSAPDEELARMESDYARSVGP